MKIKALSLIMMLALSGAANAQDNQVVLQANAEVLRSCMLDFAPATSSHQALLTFNALNISVGPRETSPTPEIVNATVYETCNDDYKIVMKSLNGGLKHSTTGYVHTYSASYPRSNDTQILNVTSQELASGVAINKTIDDWRTNHPGNEGTTPIFEPRTFSLSIPKSASLQVGYYSDTISIEITDKDASGNEIIYDVGGSAPEAPGAQVILTGGG